jgi:MoxR-like ATPase
MLPSDVVGTEIFESRAGSARPRFLPGPVFTNLLLADEINRTPPKTQAALVEAMEGQGVTVGNETRPLPEPFMVLATLNTVDSEGVYELPPGSPQLDRFMFSLCTGYPSATEESEIVERTTGKPGSEPRTAASAEELIRHRHTVRELPAPLAIRQYAAELARMTRPQEEDAPAVIRENAAWGAGPRAGQCLVLGAKARAAMSGRLCVSREDVRNIAGAVLRHRIIPAFHAAAAGTGAERLAELAVEELDARVRGRLVVGGRVRRMLRLPEPAAAKKKN